MNLEYFKRFTYTPNDFYDYMGVMQKAMAGDLVLVPSPATLANSAAAITAAITAASDDKFKRTVEVELQTAAGEVHEWFNGTFAIAATETTAGDGASAIADSAETITLTDGKGSVVVEYTGTWAGGTKQVETATASGTATDPGDEEVTVTSARFAEAEVIEVAIADEDTAEEIAAKIRTALAENKVVSAHFDVSGETTAVILTAKLALANDGTLNIAIAGDVAGVDAAATSANTTAGVAADKQTLTITGGTKLGYTVTNKTSVDTLVT